MKKNPVVVIIGAGLSGLSCALRLHEAGVPLTVLEASDRAGGRVASDRFDQYITDRGFQVLLTAYPEAKSLLNYDSLHLHNYYPGLLIWWQGRFHKFVDFRRHPLEALECLRSPLGTIDDKMKLFNFRTRLADSTMEAILSRPQMTALDVLKEDGFSDVFIDRFFRPLCGAFLLERDLTTSGQVFEFIMRSYLLGDAAIPVGGMQSIAQQMVERLPKGAVRTKSEVLALQEGMVSLNGGDTLAAQSIVVATDGLQAAGLLGSGAKPPSFKSITCLYYESKTAPVEKPFFILNAEDNALVNNVVVPSLVSRSYAPERHHLICATLLGNFEDEEEPELDQSVRKDLEPMFKDQVHEWRYLRTYRIKHSLPVQTPQDVSSLPRQTHVSSGIYICGDYCGIASINGAIESGRRAAEAVIQDLKAAP